MKKILCGMLLFFIMLAGVPGIINHSTETAKAAEQTQSLAEPTAMPPTREPIPNPSLSQSTADMPEVTISPAPFQAEKPVLRRSGDYGYHVISEAGKEASLRKVYNHGENVVLPSTIDGYKITEIGIGEEYQYIEVSPGIYEVDFENVSVFAKNDMSIKSLVIPEGVRHISANAFYGLKNLENLTLPDSLGNPEINVGAKGVEYNNFNYCDCIKEVNLPENTYMEGGFEDSVIDKLIVNSELYGYGDECPSMKGKINTIIIKQGKHHKNKNDKAAGIVGFGGEAKNVIVDKNINKIWFTEGTYGNIRLKNSACKVNIEDGTKVGKITADISNKKVKKVSGRYEYSWKPLKIICRVWNPDRVYDEENYYYVNMKSKIKYTVSAKNKSGKYKTVKKSNKTKIRLAKKSSIKVTAVLNDFKVDLDAVKIES